MKNTRILLFSIFAVMITSALIGLFISYGNPAQAAFARIFIDIGATIALAWIAYTLPKPEAQNTDDIVDGLRDLARNRFDRRLTMREQDELFQVRQAFNELAGTLSDSRDPSLTHIRYNPAHRVELKVTPLPVVHHSLHPELGQVKAAPELKEESEPVQPAVITYPEPNPDLAALTETLSEVLDNPTIMAEAAMSGPEATLALESVLAPEPEPEPAPAPAPEVAPSRPETYASDIGAADLFFLFERFKAAHDQADQNGIDFDTFLTSVTQARENLIRTHHCRDVKFEVVNEGGAVALRPRLVR